MLIIIILRRNLTSNDDGFMKALHIPVCYQRLLFIMSVVTPREIALISVLSFWTTERSTTDEKIMDSTAHAQISRYVRRQNSTTVFGVFYRRRENDNV